MFLYIHGKVALPFKHNTHMTISRSIGVFAFFLFFEAMSQAQTTPPSTEKTRGQAPTETTNPTPDKARPQTQTETGNVPKGKGRPRPHAEDGMKRADENMAKDLNLNETQKEKFKQIDEAYKAKMKAAHANKKADMDKMRAERQAAHKSVLTQEQARKYDEKIAAREAKRAEYKGGKPGGKHGKGGKHGGKNKQPNQGEKSRGDKQ